MDYLQYLSSISLNIAIFFFVLNLIINGLPSIPVDAALTSKSVWDKCFKPYYKWITFNTIVAWAEENNIEAFVLNLIINGLPSIQLQYLHLKKLQLEF